MPGSVTATSPQDQRCTHCRLYFSPQGITNHEPHCNWQDVDVESYAETVLDETHGGDRGDIEPVSVDTTTEPDDGEVDGASVEPTDTVESEPDEPQNTPKPRADGLGLEGPPETPADAIDDQSDGEDDDELACRECDESLGLTEDELREQFGRTARLTCECGHVMRWTA